MKANAKFSEGQKLVLVQTNNVSFKALVGGVVTVKQVVTYGLTDAFYWVKAGKQTFQVPEHWLK